ncbi:nucleoside-triphosphate diphosphatase [Streptococcus parasuis]|uniref:nucleoside-triphosphate diphosphatase n=1 Tax=Streptococcus parasuis TaxID=1501662 RepID=UPI00241265DC|nr:nucleoside-triphosphate diphosphatase [Streptococcus parasuis]MDG4478302.1 nucleoside-triphosphate diphosphatase [Streptococcus parasuis]
MTEKIYEYRDEQNWFIGKWEGFNSIAGIGNVSDEEHFYLNRLLTRLNPPTNNDVLSGYDVTIVRKQSDFQLFRFIVEIIKTETGRDLQVFQHQGAILVTENDKLLLVHLPQAGVSTADFFGQDKGLASVGDTILIATKNEGKTKEFRKFFERFGYQVENLNNYPDLPDVAETGMTFEENARLKAETIAELTGKMVLADDSGLKVDALGGLPGVWSARFSGPEATDERNNSKLLHELAMVFELKDRSAQFHCTLVMAAPNRESLVVEADWDGYIGMERRGENGFGYDPLFLVGETGKTAAELSLEEKNQISHRAQALEKLVEAFPVWQEQAKQS